jgi:hypothetical protein
MLPHDSGWDADDADMDALDDALSRAVDRAETLESALGAAPDERPATAAEPAATAWIWFGRESRFALDDDRGAVTETIPGHHRVKAAHESASTAVDFAEGLGAGLAEFPLAATVETFGPEVDDRVAIRHGKPDGRCFSLGRATVADRDPEEGAVTLKRELSGGGQYDGLEVSREAGDVATTKVREGRWWYPTVYRSAKGDLRGTYVNVCTPVEVFPNAIRYVDLHVDVLKHADGAVEVVDEDELADAVEAGHLGPDLADRSREVAERVASGLRD